MSGRGGATADPVPGGRWALRGAPGLAAFLAVSGFLLAAHALTVPPLDRFRPVAGARWSARLRRAWARATVRLLRVRMDVRGSLPEAPFILVTNHLGYVDIAVLLSLTDAVFVSRADVAGWPLLGALARAAGTIFVDRERRRSIPPALDAIRKALARGRSIVIFPEGTSSGGDTVLPFRSPLLEAACEAGAPVVHAGLSYETFAGDPPAREVVCWWGDMRLPGHLLRLFGLGGFRATVAFGGEPVVASDRKALAAGLRAAVLSRIQPATRSVEGASR